MDENEAIRIATEDAERVYRDLDSLYRAEVTPHGAGWRVEFVLRNPLAVGGGAVYELGPDGSITSKRYYQ